MGFPISRVDQGKPFSRLRLQQVESTHPEMLPQFRALEGRDHAGER